MTNQNKSNTVIYSDGEIELDVSVQNETVWLNRLQLSELFGRDVKTIGKHIGNVFSDGELEKSSTVANFATVQFEGGREVQRNGEFKNTHDRFMIIDSTEVYHIGASLKDLGKKWFAFSKFEMGALEVLERLKQK